MEDGGFCIVVILLLIPAIAVVMSIMKQSEEENAESLSNNSPQGYKRLNLSNPSSPSYGGYGQANNYRQNNYQNQNNYNNRNYNQNYNAYTPINNYGQNNYAQNSYNQNRYNQNNYGQQTTDPQSGKLSLYFVCNAPVNIEKYQSYIIELIDDHDRNIYLTKSQNRLNKFKLAKVVFNEINERYYLLNRNKSIGKGMTLIKSLKIKFLLAQKVRLEISLPLPFTYCISINNPDTLFNVSLKDRAINNINNEFLVNITRDDMNLVSRKENVVQEPPKEKKQKVISIDSIANASDEELISQLFNADYLKNKNKANLDNFDVNLNTNNIDFSGIELIDKPQPTYKYSPSSEDQNIRRSRINSKRDKQEEDIFATSTKQEKKQKSSYDEYLEKLREKEFKEEIKSLEEPTIEESTIEETVETENENIFENGYPVYEGSNEEIYYVYDEDEEEYEDDYEDDYEEEYREQVPVRQTVERTQKPKEVKEETSDNISNIDNIINKYVKSKPKFKTRSYTPSTYKSSLSSYSSKLSSYSSKADSMSKSISSRTSSISSRIKSRFNKDNKDNKVKESSKSNISNLSSKYLNKYSKYTKFGA